MVHGQKTEFLVFRSYQTLEDQGRKKKAGLELDQLSGEKIFPSH